MVSVALSRRPAVYRRDRQDDALFTFAQFVEILIAQTSEILGPPGVHQQFISGALMGNRAYGRIRMVREPTQRPTRE